MAIQFSSLIFKVRNALAQIDITRIDDIIIYECIQEGYDTIRMIADMLNIDIETIQQYKVERCTVQLAKYFAYRNYTKLAERLEGTEPQTSALQVSYDQSDAKQCLSLLFGCPFTDELIPDIATMNTLPTSGTMTISDLA
ncbi:MAG TPA: hypothetical protein PK024_04645 [Methanospirillum sp.]|uniref:hypothetical protein n=1 Tax=Methanospirillum sp. TaxID=45200 RepID=UPI002BE4E133|nr:hypothetical protein [Methanospirillum sp.]HOJ96113.1 hypothetical protein [Methanospirillum sp.]HPP76763.1 hypothetical protein [Methanospirillum sp.]